MADNVTMSIYLGAGEEGHRRERLILVEAARRRMTRSEFAVYAMEKQISRDLQTAKT